MVFRAPSWAAPISVLDSIPLCEFILDEQHGRALFAESKTPFLPGSGDSYTAVEVRNRVEHLAKSLSQQLGWHPNQGSEWNKVVGIFSLNTADYLPLGWAVHRLSGIAALANPTSSTEELIQFLRESKAVALFTCTSLLATAVTAAESCGIPREHVYLLDTPGEEATKTSDPQKFTTVSQLIDSGSNLDEIEPLRWEKGQGTQQCAYLCVTSGTFGSRKGVMISHQNMIAQILLLQAFGESGRENDQKDIIAGPVLFSHIYGLVVANAAAYQGESVVVSPRFEVDGLFQAIQEYQITTVYLVPPMLIKLVENEELMGKFDLSSIRQIIVGGAPLLPEIVEDLHAIQPKWNLRQAYGLTEMTGVVTITGTHDIYIGSSGPMSSLLEARLVSSDGVDITNHNEPGELWLKGPTVALGYLHNEPATKEVFQNNWLRTGDEAMFRPNENGDDHVFIIDRVTELINVKGFRVAPAELEALLVTHPVIADAAVIGVEDDNGLKVPKAFVVREPGVTTEDNLLMSDIKHYVETHKAFYKWLSGGVEFIEEIPRGTSGKILRRHLRDREELN
ncbi:uncharacterized protein GIQ15_06631 [Arthroderma uncinatum]|uniref:uncharacterized protein n=1 Tax=Arthroderma uncinatum TaxID=74035 RepID=UPI00144AE0AC|nr:uncharacterized protein GIQ15_06631 [Arthroderma uncinatum]KAF3479655.1 hypothetical protein GIQ15_06631 [Arthroderma uncinatum]